MELNRHNYEEHFILYLDNELDAAGRRAVERFLLQHPDLKEEMELLAQFRLQPDESISYPDKAELMRTPGVMMEDLLSYLDGELPEAESIRMKAVLASDDSLKKEFDLLKRTKLSAPLVPFPDKHLLYKQEKPVLRMIYWRRIAAAILLLAAVSVVLVLTSRKPGDDRSAEVAKNDDQNGTPAVQQEPGYIQAPGKDAAKDLPAVADMKTIHKPSVNSADRETQKNTFPEKHPDETLMASNHLPDASSEGTPNRIEPVRNFVKDPEYDFSNPGVTTLSPQPSNIRTVAYTPTETEIDEQEPADGKKSRLRGFFRKVTRTLEKRTNIDPTDEDGRLLVAGLAIKLK